MSNVTGYPCPIHGWMHDYRACPLNINPLTGLPNTNIPGTDAFNENLKEPKRDELTFEGWWDEEYGYGLKESIRWPFSVMYERAQKAWGYRSVQLGALKAQLAEAERHLRRIREFVTTVPRWRITLRGSEYVTQDVNDWIEKLREMLREP